MKKLDDELLMTLLLTKAMENSIDQIDGCETLDDVVYTLFANGDLVCEQYIPSIMKLTQLGLVRSNVKNEGDLVRYGEGEYEVICVTKEGNEYIDRIDAEEAVKKKVTEYFDKFNDTCKKINDKGEIIKLLGSTIAAILDLFKK